MSTRSGLPGRAATSGGQGTSRVASKSRVDRSRTLMAAPPLPQASADIIPGRFTEDDWTSMLATEDGEEVVADIVSSLTSRVMDECYKVYLARQLIPYTISQARDTILQMVEWTFISRDEGDDDTYPEKTWQEEPQPCPNDSWAQGCVPVSQAILSARSALPQALSEHPITSIPEQEAEAKPQEEESSNPSDRPPSSQDLKPSVEEKTEHEATVTPKSPPVVQPTPPPEPPKNKPRYRPYRGPLRSAGLKNITKSLEETEKETIIETFLKEKDLHESIDLLPTSLHNILKIQLGRPPQKKDVIYDGAGNVLSVPKVDLAKLPQHQVRPCIEVLDSSKEAECRVKKPNRVDGRTPIHQPHRERRVGDKGPLKRSQAIGQKRGASTFESPALYAYTFTPEHTKDPALTTAGLSLDNIQLSHGVILREGNTTERGSVLSLRQRELAWREDCRQLQPIQPSITLPNLSVEQLLKNNIPQVQPLVSFMPI